MNANPALNSRPGHLYVVATPIGNLADITLRALDTLRSVTCILAEDTRHTKKLLAHYQITTPLKAYHDHNEQKVAPYIIDQLKAGAHLALVSDAGTPLISDPGYRLVVAAQQAHLRVIPIPGPSALITALSAAGLPTDRFIFEGFLPAKSREQLNKLQTLATETRNLIFYESPHRLLATLENLATVMGQDRQATLAKELTKSFEEIYRAKLQDIIQWLKDDPQRQKGEFVLILQGAPYVPPELHTAQQILAILSEELPTKQAIKLTARITGVRKNLLYPPHKN